MSILSIVIMEILVIFMSYKVFVFFFLSSVILHDDVVQYTSLFLMEVNYHTQQYQSLNLKIGVDYVEPKQINVRDRQ